MQNETFREIGYKSSIGALGLGVINIILCFLKGIQIYDTELNGDFFSLIWYPPEICFGTVLYKISIVVVLFALLMMFVSYMVNTNGALKILMIICKVIQLVCLLLSLVLTFAIHSLSMLSTGLMIVAILEFITFILYIIEGEHRRIIIRVFLFSILTVGSGIVYMMLLFCGIAFIIFKLIRFFATDSRSSSTSYSSNKKTTSNHKSDKKIMNSGIKKKYNFSNDREIYKGKGDGRLGYGINEEFICYNNSGTGVKEFICHIKEYEEGKVQIINKGKRITDIPGCKRPKR